jgi:hypothetical protein
MIRNHDDVFSFSVTLLVCARIIAGSEVPVEMSLHRQIYV